MDKIVIENLIMRAVFDALTGKNPDHIYSDEMHWEYSVRNKEGQFLVLAKNGVLVCTLNIRRSMTFDQIFRWVESNIRFFETND